MPSYPFYRHGHVRRSVGEWAAVASMLLFSGLLFAYVIRAEWSAVLDYATERMPAQTRSIDQTLLHQPVGVRNALVMADGHGKPEMSDIEGILAPGAGGRSGLAWLLGFAWCLFAAAGSIGLVVLVQRRRRVQSLRDVERAATAERAELALSCANLGLWDWHLPSDRRTADPRANAMLGYTADEQNIDTEAGDWWRLVHPDDREAFDRALALHLRDSTLAYDVECRMRHRNGHWVWIQSFGKLVSRDAAGTPLRMVGMCMDISARKVAEAEISRLAFYDGLTKLPNRRLLRDRLGRVAFRLQQATREIDTVARLGGGEFVILLEGLGGSSKEAVEHAELVAQKILKALGVSYLLDGHELRTTPSVGVVVFGSGGHTVDELLRQADMAMYEAKAAGRNTFRSFDPGMRDAIDDSAALISELRFALVRREMMLYYQPVVNADSRMTGVEALVRWQHPTRRLISPTEFIPLAENSDLIIEIGEWVLDTACRQLVTWAAVPETAGLTIAVNVSARQLRHPRFADQVFQVLGRTGAKAHRLKLELTESMLLGDLEDIISKMTELKAGGVCFALDDFGTGYSSLCYLNRLPIDQLKIDQSFVQDMLNTPSSSSIVSTIITLARSMGLSVVAEGVETREQWQTLRSIGCTSFQGHLFGLAGPVHQLPPLMGGQNTPQKPCLCMADADVLAA